MKTVLALAAVLGLSVSTAAAACTGHKDRTASTDDNMTVASISTGTATTAEEAVKKEKAE